MNISTTLDIFDCGYASLSCFSPEIPITNFGVGVPWPEEASGAVVTDMIDVFRKCSNIYELSTDQRIEKSQWICDYSDDIYQTLRETELCRIVLGFHSEQSVFRPSMLRLLKVAAEMHRLSRTTLHLALYLLDGFMDNYTIRTEKLNLAALTCLIIAAKIEEADINAPKFVDLNKLVGDFYTLDDFRKAEMKVLMLFHFDLIRPTVATFAEYFANNVITLHDFQMYLQNWHAYSYGYRCGQTTDIVSPFYRTYDEMATALSKLLFELVDESLSYVKFANARPSVVAASCIAAVRHLSFVRPTWTPYLEKITEYSSEVVTPYMEAIIALHNLHLSKIQAMLYAAAKFSTNEGNLCDSPESGFVSVCDTKSELSDEEDKQKEKQTSLILGKRTHSAVLQEDSTEEQYDNTSLSTECPMAKRRRIIVTSPGEII
ncbi:cyclin-J [Ceratitis capitata]|uniref:(Mediterranean fruit fly) hypothetical protein n=1 Tax=Ceratitis capitata TaxID=7213 RepID=W8CBY3_CERCA|nr:cyclin-J [Ceratitis capitata]CAD7003110.1 unnamed protein product [Ceratitis capitata]